MTQKTSFISIFIFIIFLLLIVMASSSGAMPEHSEGNDNDNDGNNGNGGGWSDYGGDTGAGGFFGTIPGFGNGFGGGYGAGFGGQNGGYSKDGVIRPSVVCSERGPCYQKKVTCPARCFYSFSQSGKDFGAGGGGGGCSVDCKKNCIAVCN